MNSNSPVNFRQAFQQLFGKDCSLSHNQQLAAEASIESRKNKLHQQAQADRKRVSDVQAQIQHLAGVIKNELTPSDHETLGYLLLAQRTFPTTTVSYKTLAANIARCEKTVDRGIERFRGHRIAFTRPRFMYKKGKWLRTSNETWLNPIFTHPLLLQQLKGLSKFIDFALKQLPRFLSIWLLLSANVPAESISLYKYNNLNVEYDTHSQVKNEILLRQPSQGVNVMDNETLRDKKSRTAQDMSDLLRGTVTSTLNLTAKGQLHLMRYCDGALEYGLKNLQHHGVRDMTTNFKLFESACIQYSYNNDIDVDVQKYNELLQELGYTDNQPFCKNEQREERMAYQAPKPKSPVMPPIAHKPYYAEATQPTHKATAGKQLTHKRHIPPRSIPPSPHQTTIDVASLSPLIKDQVLAMALKMGYEDRLDFSNQDKEKLTQISTQTQDKAG